MSSEFELIRRYFSRPTAQAILGPGLSLAAPEFVVLSEEALPTEFESAAAAPGYFVVDPLDGTKDFIAGTGEYSVNIALIEAGRPTLGVMCRPSTGQICMPCCCEPCRGSPAPDSIWTAR